MAKNFEDVRQLAVERGLIDTEKEQEHFERMLAEVQAARLADIRKGLRLTQKQVAERMQVDQARVSRLESGELGSTELGSIERYIEALGGRLRLVAELGGQSIDVGAPPRELGEVAPSERPVIAAMVPPAARAKVSRAAKAVPSGGKVAASRKSGSFVTARNTAPGRVVAVKKAAKSKPPTSKA